MPIFRIFLLAGCMLAGAVHAAPVPDAKAAYVGHWKGKEMEITLHKDGKMHYKRGKPNSQKDLTFEISGFEGNDFYVSLGPVRSTFVVSKPPQRQGKLWTMTVDGVELTRDE